MTHKTLMSTLFMGIVTTVEKIFIRASNFVFKNPELYSLPKSLLDVTLKN